MRQKINRCLVICLWLLIIGLLVYSRFVNLGWSLPYPMHPDERNMANAIQQLNCKISNFEFRISNFRECGNPHFFAYGQFPLYLGYVIVFLLKFFDGDLGMPISFQEAALSLRMIAAVASIINVFVLFKIIDLFKKKRHFESDVTSDEKSRSLSASWRIGMTAGILIFSPYAIQFSHFGTTESLLMLFYSLIVYFSLKILENNKRSFATLGMTGGVAGLAIATKVSSLIFMTVPFVMLLSMSFRRSEVTEKSSKALLKFTLPSVARFLATLGMTVGGAILFLIIFSPHNLINYQDFISAFRYESAVATGQIKVFYTRQFEGTIPYLFQAIKVFPYTLGWPVYILSLLGLIFLSWKDKYLNLIRLAILIYFIPSGDIFAKWSRFMAPVFPLMLVFAILFLLSVISSIANKLRFARSLVVASLLLGMTGGAIIPGISYLSVYQNPDVRFQATDWINKNIPENSLVISETANVADIPLTYKKNINVIPFNFYDLDINPELQVELKEYLQKADYIFVPSKRIFANHTCINSMSLRGGSETTDEAISTKIMGLLHFVRNDKKCQMLKQKYPLLNKYYENLFSPSCHPDPPDGGEGSFCFKKVAEFSSGLNDEAAEETWSVFDHPVIRIYKKVKSF